VRQATNAMLLCEQVTAERSQITGVITDGHSATAILTAAEVAKDVVLRHRQDITDTWAMVLDELLILRSEGCHVAPL
jgi:hypothetical protein